MQLRLATLCLVAMVLVAAPAFGSDICLSVANNVVQNCGFETGDFTGWTQSGDTSNNFITIYSPWVSSGTFAAALGPASGEGYLSQVVWNNNLTFSFYSLPSYWGLDSVVVVPVGSCGHGCEVYGVSFELANWGDVPNNFGFWWNGVNYFSLVDAPAFGWETVSGYVQGVTPEPGSLLLFATGAVGLAGLIRRKLGR